MDRPDSPPNPLRWTLTALVVVGTLSLRADSTAACWYDPNVSGAAQSIAERFPRAARAMPEVVVCDEGDFGPMIGGDFTARPGRRSLIRIPAWQLGPRSNLFATLAHELAHAEAHEQGLAEPFGGHGTGFMAALLAAGWEQEAERVARTIVGADRALASARQMTRGRLAGAPHPGMQGSARIVCETVARHHDFILPDGRLARQTVCELVCRTVTW